MPVEEVVLANIETSTNQSDVWHWYPRKGRTWTEVGDKALCGFICDQNQFSAYPNGSECVVCVELKRK